MRTIHKYPLYVTDMQVVMMPVGARILSVDNQRDMLTLWAEVDTEAPSEGRVIHVAGTGNPLNAPSDSDFIGTVQMGQFVWHIYAGPTQ
jgi:hypothetical protein